MTSKPEGIHLRALLAFLASYREWRAAQRAYDQALDSGDPEEVKATEEQLDAAYEKYKPHQETTR